MSNPAEENFADMNDDAFFEAMNSEAVEVEAPELEPVTESEVETDEPVIEPEQEEVTDEEETEVETEEDESESTETDEVEEESDEPTDVETPELDPQLAELFSPFKADGSEMQVTSVAEARQLMQQGVAFNNRMAGFKPHRKTIKTLQANEIDDDKLNYLIDLSKGSKEAIAKLIKDNDYDVNDFDSEENSSYEPANHQVSDSEVDLDDVISRIQTSESFTTTSDIVSNQWDQASKQAVLSNPTLLENLNTQVANGTYERVKQEVVRQRAFGGLIGLSDLHAYSQVGQQMQQAGAFNAPVQPPKVVATKPKKVSTNTDKKLSASPTKRSAKSTTPKHDYVGMSDAEFEKLIN